MAAEEASPWRLPVEVVSVSVQQRLAEVELAGLFAVALEVFVVDFQISPNWVGPAAHLAVAVGCQSSLTVVESVVDLVLSTGLRPSLMEVDSVVHLVFASDLQSSLTEVALAEDSAAAVGYQTFLIAVEVAACWAFASGSLTFQTAVSAVVLKSHPCQVVLPRRLADVFV